MLQRAGAITTIVLALMLPFAAFGSPDAESAFESLLHRGFELHNQADYAHALPLLEQALKLRPRDYFANLLVGIDLLRTGKPEQSLDFLKEASRQRPKEDFPYDYMGEAHAVLGHYAEAAESHTRAMEVEPASPEAMESSVNFWVERFRQMSGNLRSSDRGLAEEHRLQAMSYAPADPRRQELLQRAVNLDANAPGIWSDLAFANLASGDSADAERNVDRALQHDPNNLRALQVRALLAAHAGVWSDVYKDLDTIAQRSPRALAHAAEDWPRALQPPSHVDPTRPAGAFLACVAKSCTAAEFSHALPATTRSGMFSFGTLYREERWERLAALPAPQKDDSSAWFRRGVSLAQLDRCTQASPALERSLHDESDSVYAQFLLCWCYAKQAGEATERLQTTAGNEAIAHMVRGDVLLRMQANSAAAAAEYTAALAEHPDDPQLLERLAEAQSGNGQSDAASESASAALRLDPHRFAAMRTLAHVAMEQRRYDAALPYLEQLAAHDPKDAAAQVDLGTAFAQTGNPAAALEYLAPALQHGYPDEKGSLHALLGSVLRHMGRTEEAAQSFATARSLSDEFQRSAHRGSDDQK